MCSYFLALLLIGHFSSRHSNSESYFSGNHQSPWYAVAFGLIGDSLSGVTYISVPGAVGYAHFSYLQVVLGYVIGYWAIAYFLLPIYYQMQLTSIYTYLGSRFGPEAEKTGAFFFLLSRILGAAARLFLAAGVMQIFLFDPLGIPFTASVFLIIVLMLVYTLKGGIKTLVWTDVFQSGFLLMGVVLSIFVITQALDIRLMDLPQFVSNSDLSSVFIWDWRDKAYFWKHFLAGIFIAFTMTGLDQNMMQKNLSMRTLSEAQKNLYWFSGIVLVVNALFLSLGVLLYAYATAKGVGLPLNETTGKVITDDVFPFLALNHLGSFAALVFITGLTAATFNSADSVLTTLTTSFYIDILHMKTDDSGVNNRNEKIRKIIHISFGLILFLVIMLFKLLNNRAVIDTVLVVAGYTYGPLLGLFVFGLFSKRTVPGLAIPVICILSPFITYWFSLNAEQWLNGYKPGYELLMFNAGVTWMGLWLASLTSYGSKK